MAKKKWLLVSLLILIFGVVVGLSLWKIKKPVAVVSPATPATTPILTPTAIPTVGNETSTPSLGGDSGVIDQGEEVVQ